MAGSFEHAVTSQQLNEEPSAEIEDAIAKAHIKAE
jgi:hypothetical protein